MDKLDDIHVQEVAPRSANGVPWHQAPNKETRVEFENNNNNNNNLATNLNAAAMVDNIMDIKKQYMNNSMAQVFDEKYFSSLLEDQKLRLLTICLSGVKNPESTMGCYALNHSDYEEFKPFFKNLFSHYYKADLTSKRQISNWNVRSNLDLSEFGLDKVSMRIRTCRNLRNYPLPSSMTKDDRINMEKEMQKVFDVLIAKQNYGGRYVSLTPGHENFIETTEYDILVKNHIMFKDLSRDKYLNAAGIANDWPYGRGCYHSRDKGFIIWVGEEDHLRIMCMKTGSILNEVLDLLKTAIDVVEKLIDGGCATSEDFGVITSCPTNLGTGMRASVLVKLPNLCKDGTDKRVVEVCKPMGLSVRGTGGEHTPIVDNMVDVSPSTRFGISESEIVVTLYNGIKELMAVEKAGALVKFYQFYQF